MVVTSGSIQVDRATNTNDLAHERQRLVDRLRRGGIRNETVLEALLQTPRHRFVPRGLRQDAYVDAPLPIGGGQTISQPWVVARMTELLLEHSPGRVLEVGTGSGYQAAVLARLVDEVFTVERLRHLAKSAKTIWQELGLDNISSRHADGCLGWASEAPFDAIMVTAGSGEVPVSLYDQLAEGGRLVMPVGHGVQRLLVSDLRDGEHSGCYREGVRFVPLLPGLD